MKEIRNVNNLLKIPEATLKIVKEKTKQVYSSVVMSARI